MAAADGVPAGMRRDGCVVLREGELVRMHAVPPPPRTDVAPATCTHARHSHVSVCTPRALVRARPRTLSLSSRALVPWKWKRAPSRKTAAHALK